MVTAVAARTPGRGAETLARQRLSATRRARPARRIACILGNVVGKITQAGFSFS